jgi:DNA processing protein
MQTTLFYWHLLNTIPGLGSQSMLRLMRYFNDPLQAIDASPAMLQQLGLPCAVVEKIKACANTGDNNNQFINASRNWDAMHEQNIIPIAFGDDKYPARLALIADAPAMLYTKGNLAVLKEPQVAIVGSRNASHEALALAQAFAKELAVSGITVTSGMALGIDGQAHCGAIAGGGDTCAVLGSGVDVIYPARHKSLAENIEAQGVLVSEYLPASQPRPGHFPKRNRIIAGLSCGVLVVEAALKSGSLITARLAMEYNREVFAIPGSIHNPRARGCHWLIRQGAVLVETVADMLTELESTLGEYVTGEPAKKSNSPAPKLAKNLALIIEAMGYNPISIDALSERLAIPIDELSSRLLDLELQGWVIAVAGGYQRCQNTH